MYWSSLRFVVTGTLLVGATLASEIAQPPRRTRVEVTPRGWLHERAVQRYEQNQQALRDSLVAVARSQLGIPYVFGGASPMNGFDCSGLVRWVLAQVQVPTPRTARQQATIGAPIERTRLRPGDLLTFGVRDSITHVGIYIGDGRFVHASSVAGKVIVSPVDRPPSELIKPLRGARRILLVAEIDGRRRS